MAWQYLDLIYPQRGEPSWTKAGFGDGKNHALCIDKTDGFILANCCGAVHACWVQHNGDDNNLCTGNAGSYWDFADGLEKGQEARLGAILCYSGHVEYVVGYNDETKAIMTVYSAYRGTMFELLERAYPYEKAGQTFLGFKYPPKKPDIKVGDKVIFVGEYYYYSENGERSKECAHGECVVKDYVEGAKHPYYVKRTFLSTSAVYGWVDLKDLES